MKQPSFIFFDLGNVLLTFDHRIACRRLGQLTGVAADRFHHAIFDSGLQRQYEVGAIDSATFAGRIAQETDISLDPTSILQVCSDIFRLNDQVLPIIRQLRAAGYRLGILSNTCQAHWEWVDDGRYQNLTGHFEARVLSYEEKSMKPDSAIYLAASRAANVAPEQIFFTDDRIENVDGAKHQGIDATLFTDATQLIRDLGERRVNLG